MIFTGNLSVKTSDMLKGTSVVLPQPSKSTNHLVFKRDLMIFHQDNRGINNKTDEILLVDEPISSKHIIFIKRIFTLIKITNRNCVGP
jgi:hypothetical protein